MKRLAVVPSDAIADYLKGGYSESWLRTYYNPCGFFDEVYLLSPLEKDNPDLLGMKAIHTQPRDLPQRIKDLRIDVIRAYGGNWACRMACDNKVPGVPVAVSVHDRRPQKLYDSIRKADVVFCTSRVVRELVLSKFPQPDRAWILPNRVDFQIMRPWPESHLIDFKKQFPTTHQILFVGRLSLEKNLDTLIKALKILGKEYGLLIVGSSPDNAYPAMAQKEQVSNQCFWLGNVPQKQLARYYTFCDCMCTPSRDEGFGMVFIEALSCRAVVVTSDIAPMNEYIIHGQNGLLVADYENPESLAKAIRQACTDQKLRTDLKTNAGQSVERFGKSDIDRLETGYYQKILAMKEQHAFSS